VNESAIDVPEFDPCPKCGERLGGRYEHEGQLVCWPCTGLKLLRVRRAQDLDWIAYRKAIIAALQRDGTFIYINADRVAGCCPICKAPLGVRFKDRQPAADLHCHGGCSEHDVAANLGKRARDRR
jgi:hypothetical protein